LKSSSYLLVNMVLATLSVRATPSNPLRLKAVFRSYS
jgi:hypothetical protein